jgi:hypothetical protein
MRYTIKFEFAGCMMPVHEIAKGFGLNVKKSYPSRQQAQSVCDHVGAALIAFGMKEVKLWTLAAE